MGVVPAAVVQELLHLLLEPGRHLGVDVGHHRLQGRVLRRLGGLDGRVDVGLNLVSDAGLLTQAKST